MLVFPSNPMAVRTALEQVIGELADQGILPDDMMSIQIVLAEVMNNVVEHAYADNPDGQIELRLCHAADGLTCDVFDRGTGMPFYMPPAGTKPDVECEIEELPEGGFGWFLIRDLTDELTYSRKNDQNRLSFRMALSA